MKRVVLPFALGVVLLGSACTRQQQPPPPQPYAQGYGPPPPGYGPQQGYPPPQQGYGPPQGGYPPPQQRYPAQPYPQQPQQPYPPPPQRYPVQPPPPPPPPPSNLGRMSSDPDVVAACRKAENDWRQACGCPVRIVVDMNTTAGLTTSVSSEHDFELDGKHFCEAMTSGSDIHGKSIAISSFCKGREREMCGISSIHFVRVAKGHDCTLSNGVATPQSEGTMYSLVDNCYQRVTKW